MDCSPPGSSAHGIFQARTWSGLPFTSPGDLVDPGVEPGSLTSACTGRQILYHWCHLGRPFTAKGLGLIPGWGFWDPTSLVAKKQQKSTYFKTFKHDIASLKIFLIIY